MSNYTSLSCRELLALSREEVYALPDGLYKVSYEDGVVNLIPKVFLEFDRTFWDLYSLFPNTPLISDGTIYGVIGDSGYYNGGTIIKCIDTIYRHICEFNNLRRYSTKEELSRMVYITFNNFFNEFILNASESQATVDITDFVNFIELPEMQEIKEQYDNSPASINNAYKLIKKIVSEGKYDSNLIDSSRCDSARWGSFIQTVGPRGIVTDLDRSVYPIALNEGFVYGLHSLYEIAAESRTAAKALNAAGNSIRKSEYASRRFQLLTMSVERAIFGDCGSRNYMEVVMDERYLKAFIGKWYVIEEGDVLKDIKGNETHLYGKLIKVRNTFGCELPNRHHVCTTCLGRVSENIKENTNLGIKCSQYFMKDVTQGILSLKHNVKSVDGGSLLFDKDTSKVFRSNRFNEIFIRENENLKECSLVLDGQKLYKLGDVLSVESEDIPMVSIGSMTGVGLVDKEGKVIGEYSIAEDDMPAHITRDLLNYLKDSDFEVDTRSNYIIPLEKWDPEVAMFKVELKEEDVNAYIAKMEKTVEGTIEKHLPFKEHFFRLVDLILERTSCNVMILEVLCYATSAFNLAEGDLRLGRGSPNLDYAKRNDIFMSRSISQFLIFEKQMQMIRSKPHVVLSLNFRQRHPLDVYIMPKETVEANKDYQLDAENEMKRLMAM